jgi:hypothetical protein
MLFVDLDRKADSVRLPERAKETDAWRMRR